MSDSLGPQGLQHIRLLCSSPSPRVCSNSCQLSQWCYLTTSSSAAPFSFLPSVFPRIRVFSNESVLHIRWSKYWSFSLSISPSNEYSGLISYIQGWFPLRLTGLISLQSKGLSRVFSSTTIQNHQPFDARPSSWSKSHIHKWLLEKPKLWPT